MTYPRSPELTPRGSYTTVGGDLAKADRNARRAEPDQSGPCPAQLLSSAGARRQGPGRGPGDAGRGRRGVQRQRARRARAGGRGTPAGGAVQRREAVPARRLGAIRAQSCRGGADPQRGAGATAPLRLKSSAPDAVRSAERLVTVAAAAAVHSDPVGVLRGIVLVGVERVDDDAGDDPEDVDRFAGPHLVEHVLVDGQRVVDRGLAGGLGAAPAAQPRGASRLRPSGLRASGRGGRGRGWSGGAGG